MDDYHLMADFFSTWRSMNDTTKNIFIIGFYLTILACFFTRYWLHEWLANRRDIRRFVLQNHKRYLGEHPQDKAETPDSRT